MRYEPTRATDPGPGWRTRRPPPSYEEKRGEDPTRTLPPSWDMLAGRTWMDVCTTPARGTFEK